MNYDQLETIIAGDPEGRWFRGTNDEIICKEDLDLRFVPVDFGLDEGLAEYLKNWTRKPSEKFPDKNLTRSEYALYYGSTSIREYTLLNVDGHRYILPVPFPREGEENLDEGGSVSRSCYLASRILCSAFGHDFERGMRQGKLDVPTEGEVL